jgi:hypothetical protein
VTAPRRRRRPPARARRGRTRSHRCSSPGQGLLHTRLRLMLILLLATPRSTS